MKSNYLLPILVSLSFAAGCGLDGPAPGDSKPAPVAPQTADNAGATKSPAEANRADLKPAAAPSRPTGAPAQTPAVATETKTSTAASPESKPRMVREEAQVGMGEKGRGYGNGLIPVVAASYWSTKERLALMQIQHNMDLYKGEHGYFPKTHAEFMEEIVKKGDLQLPKLPEGHKYQYDPETATLMILRPADPNEP
jgi:hypothetical protein